MAFNIAYVHGIGEIGGAEKDLLSYLDLLDRNNFHPHVVCLGKGMFFEQASKKQIPIAVVCLPPWRKLKGLIKLPLAVVKLVKIFRQWKIDLVHVNDYWWFPQTYLAARICRVPIVVHLRQQIEAKRVKQYWLKKPDHLFPVSKSIENVLLEMGVNPSHICLVYSGIDTKVVLKLGDKKEYYSRYGLAENAIVVGTVANIFPRKGYEYLIEALVEVKKSFSGVTCFIVGEGDKSYYEKLVRLIGEKDLIGDIRFVGYQEDVYKFLNIFDVFVLPSIMEGFGIALLEAMAMSKPIVASSVGGVPEAIIDGVTGILVQPKNSKELANAIIRILRDDHLKKRLGLAARESVNIKFNQDNTIKIIQNSYRAMIEEARCF